MKQNIPTKLLPTLFIFWLFVFFTIIIQVAFFFILHLDEINSSIIQQKIPTLQLQSDLQLPKKSIANQTFRANFNNLSSLKISLNRLYCSAGTIKVRIREETSSSWYATQIDIARELEKNDSFMFSFPTISRSRDYAYVVEIECENRACSLASVNPTKFDLEAQYEFNPFANKTPLNDFVDFFISSLKWVIKELHLQRMVLFVVLGTGIIFFVFRNKSQFLKTFEYKIHKLRSFRIGLTIPDSIVIFFLFSLSFFINCKLAPLGIDPHHDGIMFKPALDVSQGSVLFRDTFSQYGALTTLLQAAALSIFGERLIVIKFLTAFIYGLISGMLYVLYRRYLPKLLTTITVIITILMEHHFLYSSFFPWSSIYAMLFQLMTMLFIIKHQSNNKYKFAFFSGISAALCMMCRQPVGVFAFLAILVHELYLYYSDQKNLKNAFRSFFFVTFGFLTTVLVFATCFLMNGSFIDWIKQSYLFSAVWSKSFESIENKSFIIISIRSLIPGSNIWTVYPLATILSFILNRKNIQLTALCFLSVASWFQYFPIPSADHLYYGAAPMIPLLGLLVYRTIKTTLNPILKLKSSNALWLTILILIFIHFPELAKNISSGMTRSKEGIVLQTPQILEGMRVSKSDASSYEELNQLIQKYFTISPNGNILQNSRSALFISLDTRIKNIHKATVNWPTLIDGVYPEYKKVYEAAVDADTAMIFSDENILPGSGYCRLGNGYKFVDDFVYVFIPCKINEKMKI